jgi:putative transcriptional regulator
VLTFIETRLFSKLADELLGDDGLRELQMHLMKHPVEGALIRRLVVCERPDGRCQVAGKVAESALSTTYVPSRGRFGCLLCIPRMSQIAFRRMYYERFVRRLKMKTKTRRNIGLEILEGLREIKRGQHGRVTTLPSVAAIRERTGLSQSRFSELLGVSARTLQEWEQGRRAPSGAARTLLLIAAKNLKALLAVS